MDEKPSQKPAGGYGKHSKKYWALIYVAGAIVVYGLIYLLFFHKSGGSSGSFSY